MGKQKTAKSKHSNKLIPVREALDKAFSDMEELETNFEIEMGYTFLNQLLIGIGRPRLTIISTPTNVGSGYLGASIITDLAINNNRSIGYYSLRVSNSYSSGLMLSVVADVDFRLMRNGRLPSDQWPALSGAARDLAESIIFIDDSRPLSVKTFRRKAVELMKNSKIDLFVIDNLQYIFCKKYHKNKARNYQRISQALKDISDELNVSILLMSQFSDAYEPDDIDVTNECGSLPFHQDYGKIPDAELCLIPGSQDRENRLFSLHICRNREGVTGTIDLKQNLYGGGFEQYWE